MTRIFVVREKHGNRYFDVTTDEQLHKVALFLLQSRFDEGCWYFQPEAVPALDFNEEDIPKMPASMQFQMREKLKSHRKEYNMALEEQEDYDEIVKALETHDGALAACILVDRDGYEYEGCRIEECEEIEEVENGEKLD